MPGEIRLYQRPCGRTAEQIVNIAQELTSRWFTANVPDDIRKDLSFHDVFCLEDQGEVASFLVFTSLDGMIQIILMGTRLCDRGKGYGSLLIDRLADHARQLGYGRMMAMTVPPDTKPAYAATVRFYERHGFSTAKRYDELWESGALEMVKDL